MSNPATLLPPGFRFHPTDEELILHYLRNRAAALPCLVSIIAEVDIYKFDPWHLPERAMFGDREWYFFSPRDRKYPNGVRPNRAAGSGYWKATGTDKPIVTAGGKGIKESIGVKKALVFYRGKPPKGVKTEWIMHEYRLAGRENGKSKYVPTSKIRDSSMRLDDWVLCRIYKKSSSQEAEKEPPSPAEDVFIPTPTGATALQKSYSLSELLNAVDYSEISRLLEMPGAEHINSLGFPSSFHCSSDSSSYLAEPSAPTAESGDLKRHWSCFADGSEVSVSLAEKKSKWEKLDDNFEPLILNQQLITNGYSFY